MRAKDTSPKLAQKTRLEQQPIKPRAMPSSALCFGIAHLFFMETALIPPDERFLLFPDY